MIRLSTVDSTNNYAATGLARHELGHGTAILAMEQTAGQGQRGRQWRSAPGLDLAMSVVLLPEHLPVMEQFTLSKAAALAVHDVVAEVLATAGRDVEAVRIKWPNDVLIGHSKVSGILIANEVKGAQVASSVVGIGLNVNSSRFDPAFGATSLRQETGRRHDVEDLAGRLCRRMQHWWTLVGGDDPAIATAFTRLLWARGRFADFTLDGAEWTARPLDVDAHGRLIVEDEGGAVAAYGLERLRFRRSDDRAI